MTWCSWFFDLLSTALRSNARIQIPSRMTPHWVENEHLAAGPPQGTARALFGPSILSTHPLGSFGYVVANRAAPRTGITEGEKPSTGSERTADLLFPVEHA
jgi:hypothetical protein